MASVMQGDAYNIPVTIKSGNGTLITPEIAACVEITVGQFTKRWPGQVTFDEKTGEWKFPVTQKQTFRFAPGTAVVQARVVFQDGSIMGGSGAPVRVEQSASHGTLPQPEKAEAVTGSAPKATEVTIPTVHDIDVSLHSQVILSDPIKAPYIGDNGNWYEYDAATGTFVDTGTPASGTPPITPDTAGKYLTNDGSKAEWGVLSGGTDSSLGITGASVGQIIKVKAVDTDGKPTSWTAVDMPGAEEWELIEVIPLTAGVTLYDIANFSVYKKIAISMVKPVTTDGNGTVFLRIYKLSDASTPAVSYIIDGGWVKANRGYVELVKDEPFLQYLQLYRNNDITPGTGGASVPRDNLDLTDLGAVKIALPESYSQNFDGTGTMTIRGMR